jgi:hypothetical protein
MRRSLYAILGPGKEVVQDMRNVLVLRFSKHIAAVLMLVVAAQMSEAAVLPMQEQQQPMQTQEPAPAQIAATQGPGKPGAEVPQAPDPAGQQPEPGFASHSQDAVPQDAQQPVGTAAGPYAKPSGMAGSRPAGAAIAPAKQKRKKAILISVGLIIGGAVAVGAVAGLSKGSPSHP